MVSVKIPDDVKPVWECSINGRDYQYPAGATVSVPDEVAALIANVNAAKPKQAIPEETQAIKRPKAANKVLKSNAALEWVEGEMPQEVPSIGAGDVGKVLSAGESGPEWTTPSAGVYFVPFSVDVGKHDTDETEVTTTATFAEVVAAYKAGKEIIAKVTVLGMTIVGGSTVIYPSDEPTILSFCATVDTSSIGEDPAPQMMKILFSAGGASAISIPISVESS